MSGRFRLNGITVEVRRGATVSLQSLPPRSIAIDGYVQGPQIDTAEQRFSFDHHANCVRVVTAATCKQVLDALVLGLDPEGFTVWVNDVDGDTALSVALLANPDWVTLPQVHELVRVVGDFDAHGPAYRGTNSEVLRSFWHAMAPEQQAVADGSYATCDLAALLRECVARIGQLVDGTLQVPPAEPDQRSYSVLHRGESWVMVEGVGYLHDLAYADGFRRVITCCPQADGTWAYTIGKQSEFVTDFPVGPAEVEGTLLHRLALVEPGWGGGSTIGGAPRLANGGRSSLPPQEVALIVEDVLAGR